MRFLSRPDQPRSTHLPRRLRIEPLERRDLLSIGYVELGPSDNIALDQPRIVFELWEDIDPDPDEEQWIRVGPDEAGMYLFNTFLLDTGANSILAMANTVYYLTEGSSNPYTTQGEFIEVGIGGPHPMDISAAYRFDFAGTNGVPHRIMDVRILSDDENNFSDFGPWGLAGMPAMANRVTTLDMTGWSGGGGEDLLDLYMRTQFSDQLPAGGDHRYALSVDNRLAFNPLDYLESGEPPVWADIPFLTAIPTTGGVGAEGNFLFDTGAQMSIISQHLALELGLDTNGDGLLDQNDAAYLGSETVGGVGGSQSVPIFAIDELRVPVTKVSTGEEVDLVWTDLQWLVMDIEVSDAQEPLDGVFGSDLLTSGWFHALFYPGMPDGYINQVHFDFRNWDLYSGEAEDRSGEIYFDLNPDVDHLTVYGPGVRLRESLRSTEVIEGATTDTYTLALQTMPRNGADVQITVTADAQTRISIDGGATFHTSLVVTLDDLVAQTITVEAVDDGLAEGEHTGIISHTVTSADPDYDGFVIEDLTVHIVDNQELIRISTDAAGQHLVDSIDVAEGEGPTTYYVCLAEAPSAETYLQTENLAGQVTAFNPNNTMGDGWENIWIFNSGNWNTPQPIVVEAVDDTTPEGPHATQFVFSSIIAYPFDMKQCAVPVAIADDDAAAVVVTEPPGGLQLFEGGAAAAYQIALSRAPSGPVQVTATADPQTEISIDGGATYHSSLVLTFDDTTSQTITVRTIDDAVFEGAHSGHITHAVTGTVHDPMYPADLAITAATAAISDNDQAGLIVSSDAEGLVPLDSMALVEGGDDGLYWVRLTSEPRHDVTLILVDAQGQVTAQSDAHPDRAYLEFTPADWNIPQAVRLTAIADGIDEGPHAISLVHEMVSSDPVYTGDSSLSVYIDDAAFDLVVSTLDDIVDDDYSAGQLSLREALRLAAGAPGEDVIRFAEELWGETIALTQGPLPIDSDVTLLGPGADWLTIGVSGAFGAMAINDPDVEATIAGLTIEGGIATLGGGVSVTAGSLLLDGVVIRQCAALCGGAISATAGAQVTVLGSSLLSNTSTSSGGAVFADGATTVVELRADASGTPTRLIDNSAVVYGGAAFAVNGATLRLLGSAISATAPLPSGERLALAGGGLAAYRGGTLEVEDSTFERLSATMGGAIYASRDDSSVAISAGSRLSENTARSGGGVCVVHGAVATVSDTVLEANRATHAGGAIAVQDAGSSLTLASTNLVDNRAAVVGGGLYVATGATVAMDAGLITGAGLPVGALSAFLGGAIAVDCGGEATLTGTQIAGNRAHYGAGIYANGPGSAIALTNTTVSGNSATRVGSQVFQKAAADVLADRSTTTIEDDDPCDIVGDVQWLDLIPLAMGDPLDSDDTEGALVDAALSALFGPTVGG